MGREPILPTELATDRRYRYTEDDGQAYSQQWHKAFSTVAVTESQRNNFHHVFSWVGNLKIMVFCVIDFIFFLICILLFIALNHFPNIVEQRKERRNNQPKKINIK